MLACVYVRAWSQATANIPSLCQMYHPVWCHLSPLPHPHTHSIILKPKMTSKITLELVATWEEEKEEEKEEKEEGGGVWR